eukprot:s5991_g2.t1
MLSREASAVLVILTAKSSTSAWHHHQHHRYDYVGDYCYRYSYCFCHLWPSGCKKTRLTTQTLAGRTARDGSPAPDSEAGGWEDIAHFLNTDLGPADAVAVRPVDMETIGDANLQAPCFHQLADLALEFDEALLLQAHHIPGRRKAVHGSSPLTNKPHIQ